MFDNHVKIIGGLEEEEYLVIILGKFSPFLHKNIHCGYLLELPHVGDSNKYNVCFMEK